MHLGLTDHRRGRKPTYWVSLLGVALLVNPLYEMPLDRFRDVNLNSVRPQPILKEVPCQTPDGSNEVAPFPMMGIVNVCGRVALTRLRLTGVRPLLIFEPVPDSGFDS